MGGAETELGPGTTRVLIEAAHCDPVTIARAAKRRHRLPSEASKRFERGVDPTIAATAARRVADLMVRLGGGRVADAATIVGQPVDEPISIDDQLPSRVAGFPIESETSARALTLVGCSVSSSDGVLTATPPPWRHDLRDPNDLVEEVVRVVGYDKVPSVLPSGPRPAGG